jgi:hypothetical protein
MSRPRRALCTSPKYVLPGESFLREQQKIRERRRVRRALHALDFGKLYEPSAPRWAAWS